MKLVVSSFLCVLFLCMNVFAENLTTYKIDVNDDEVDYCELEIDENEYVNCKVFTKPISTNLNGDELKKQFYNIYENLSKTHGKGTIHEYNKIQINVSNSDSFMESLSKDEYFLYSTWLDQDLKISVYCKAVSENLGYIIIDYKLNIIK